MPLGVVLSAADVSASIGRGGTLRSRQHQRQSAITEQRPTRVCLSGGSRRARARGVGFSSRVLQIPSAVSTDVSTAGQESATLKGASPSVGGARTVVITGSTKGIGLALAQEFLRAGDSVLLTSRSGDRVAEVTERLRGEHGAGRVFGTPCDVSSGADVASLAEFARGSLGEVDLWVNNAGTNAYFYGPLVECEEEALREIVNTNLLGIMLCCREAIQLMRSQNRTGHIFNMDGAGADGNATPLFAAYGATKRSLSQFTSSLQAELRMLDIQNVVLHNLSPGMVTTELLMSGADTPQAKFFINALAEPADDVARFLVPRIREVTSGGDPSPSYIKFLTRPKAFSQILQRAILQRRKGRYVAEV